MLGAPSPLREQVLSAGLRTTRYPLPAGHPITWGALIEGTSLEGLEYPGPKWFGLADF